MRSKIWPVSWGNPFICFGQPTKILYQSTFSYSLSTNLFHQTHFTPTLLALLVVKLVWRSALSLLRRCEEQDLARFLGKPIHLLWSANQNIIPINIFLLPFNQSISSHHFTPTFAGTSGYQACVKKCLESVEKMWRARFGPFPGEVHPFALVSQPKYYTNQHFLIPFQPIYFIKQLHSYLCWHFRLSSLCEEVPWVCWEHDWGAQSRVNVPGDHPEFNDSAMVYVDKQQQFQSIIGMLHGLWLWGELILLVMCWLCFVSVLPQRRRTFFKHIVHIFGFLLTYKKTGIKLVTTMHNYSMFNVEQHDGRLFTRSCPSECLSQSKNLCLLLLCWCKCVWWMTKLLFDLLLVILFLLHEMPIDWYSKLQNTVETAIYGSEFVAACIDTQEVYSEFSVHIENSWRSFLGWNSLDVWWCIIWVVPQLFLGLLWRSDITHWLAHHHVCETIAAGIFTSSLMETRIFLMIWLSTCQVPSGFVF